MPKPKSRARAPQHPTQLMHTLASAASVASAASAASAYGDSGASETPLILEAFTTTRNEASLAAFERDIKCVAETTNSMLELTQAADDAAKAEACEILYDIRMHENYAHALHMRVHQELQSAAESATRAAAHAHFEQENLDRVTATLQHVKSSRARMLARAEREPSEALAMALRGQIALQAKIEGAYNSAEARLDGANVRKVRAADARQELTDVCSRAAAEAERARALCDSVIRMLQQRQEGPTRRVRQRGSDECECV